MENNYAIIAANAPVEGPFQVIEEDGEITIRVGMRIMNGMTFPREYLLENRDEFLKLAEKIEITIQDAELEEASRI